MSLVLGIDGGGTKTVCILMDDRGEVLGRGEAGASNYLSVGKQAAFSSIQSAIALAICADVRSRSVPKGRHGLASQTQQRWTTSRNAFAIASLTPVRVEAICLGLAGVGRPSDIQVVDTLMQQLQSSNTLPITWALQPSTRVICNDAMIALVGGLGHAVGVVAIAGTGSIVFGRNFQGHTKRVGGWGHFLGDSGSAYHIAVSGLRAALKAYDGYGLSTTLPERFRDHLGLSSLEDVVKVIYQQGWSVKDIAALAPIVLQEAASGDEVSLNIIEDAVQELVQATHIVINHLFSPSEVIEVVTTGSVWIGCSLMRDKFAASLVKRNPLIKVIFPRHEPAYGAGLLALATLS